MDLGTKYFEPSSMYASNQVKMEAFIVVNCVLYLFSVFTSSGLVLGVVILGSGNGREHFVL